MSTAGRPIRRIEIAISLQRSRKEEREDGRGTPGKPNHEKAPDLQIG
jgi:hypothetical protein